MLEKSQATDAEFPVLKGKRKYKLRINDEDWRDGCPASD
jgi:hypothetical protein